MNVIGNNIKEILENQNKTQKWLAEQLKVTNATVSAWIKGINIPRTPKLNEIAEVLNVTTFELISTPMENPAQFYSIVQNSINMSSNSEYDVWLKKQPVITTPGKSIDYLTERILYLKNNHEKDFAEDLSFLSAYDVRFLYEFRDFKKINLDNISLSNVQEVATQWQSSEKALAQRVLIELQEIALRKNREMIKKSFLKEKVKLKRTLKIPLFTLEQASLAHQFLVENKFAAYQGKNIEELSDSEAVSYANLMRDEVGDGNVKQSELDKHRERNKKE